MHSVRCVRNERVQNCSRTSSGGLILFDNDTKIQGDSELPYSYLRYWGHNLEQKMYITFIQIRHRFRVTTFIR
jgi:hypothetical protein